MATRELTDAEIFGTPELSDADVFGAATSPAPRAPMRGREKARYVAPDNPANPIRATGGSVLENLQMPEPTFAEFRKGQKAADAVIAKQPLQAPRPARNLVDIASDAASILGNSVIQSGKPGADLVNMVTGGALDKRMKNFDVATTAMNKLASPATQFDRETLGAIPEGETLAKLAQIVGNPALALNMALPSAATMLPTLGIAKGAALLAPKSALALGDKFSTGAAVGANALMNAGDTFGQTNSDLGGRLLAALSAGTTSALVGKLTGGGLEGQLARGGKVPTVGAALKAVGMDSLQEGGENIGNSLAQDTGEGKPLNFSKALDEGAIGAVLSPFVAGPINLQQVATSPERANAKLLSDALNGFAPGAAPAPLDNSINKPATQQIQAPAAPETVAPSAQKQALIALGYDPQVVNALPDFMIAGLGPESTVQPMDMREKFGNEAKAMSDAEVGLTPDVVRAQQTRSEPEAFQPAPSDLLQRLKDAGWTPPQQGINPTPDPETVAGISTDLEKQYQADVKEGIKNRLGLPETTQEPDAPKRISPADSPIISAIAKQGIALDERAEVGTDTKRITQSRTASDGVMRERIMPNAINVGGKPLYREGGMRGDMLAEKLQSLGYLTQEQIDEADASLPGGAAKLAHDLIARELANPGTVKQVEDQYAGMERQYGARQTQELDTAAQRFGIDTRGMSPEQIADTVRRTENRQQRSTEPDFQERKTERVRQREQRIAQQAAELQAAMNELQLQRIIDRDQAENLDVEGLMRGMGFTEQEISDHVTTKAEASRRPDESRQATQGRADGSPANGTQTEAGTAQSAAQTEGLTSYTPYELRARDERIAEQAKAEARQQLEAENKATADREQKEVQARQQASANKFQLGQSADESLSGQRNVFEARDTNEVVTNDAALKNLVLDGYGSNGIERIASDGMLAAKTVATAKQQSRPIFIMRGNFGREQFKQAIAEAKAAGIENFDKMYVYADLAPYSGKMIDFTRLDDVVGFDRLANKPTAPDGGGALQTETTKRALTKYRSLTGEASASQAKTDAEQALGMESPVPVMPASDAKLGKAGVPMWYSLSDKVIYYNTAYKGHDRAFDAQYMVEEIMHAVDHIDGNRTISASSEALHKGGEIRTELEAAIERSSTMLAVLKYPLKMQDKFSEDRIVAELFARTAVIYNGFPDLLRAAAPKTYEAFHGLFSGRNEGVRSQARQGATERVQESDRRTLDRSGSAGVAETGKAGQASDGLAGFRARIAGAIGGDADGRPGEFGGQSLEAREPDKQTARAAANVFGGGRNTTPTNPNNASSAAQTPWHVVEPGRLDAIIRHTQNNRIDIKRTVDTIKASGQQIADDANPYLKDELYIGRVRDQLDRLADDSVTPMLRAVANSKIEVEDVNRYLWARHAEERNKQMAKVNQTPFTPGLDLAGMSTADAQAELKQFAARPDFAKLQRIAAMVDGITKDTRQHIITEGLEDKATIQAWEGAYKNYVPLQRDIEESGGRAQGYNVKGSESRRAVGSKKEAVNILANVIAQAESAIIRAEKAKVGRSVLELAEQSPNPDFWMVDTPPTERAIDPKTGVVTSRVVPNFLASDNTFVVKENGVERYVVFNDKNPRAVEFVRNLKNLDASSLRPLVQATGKSAGYLKSWVTTSATNIFTNPLAVTAKGTRYLSQWVTARNPLFWATNFVRDTQEVAFNLQSTPLKGQAPQTLARVPFTISALAMDAVGKKGGKLQKWVDEYNQSGAKTGFMLNYENSVERMGEITKEIERMQQPIYDPRKIGRGLLDVIDTSNDVIENGVRLAVFIQAREQGISVDQSASIAKNISVNFNRKGNGTSIVNALYMFANANVQGHVRMLTGIATSRTAQMYAVAMVAAGAAMTMLNWAISGDDDESRKRRYALVPQHERERNWILFYPNSDKYIKIPIGIGPSSLFNAGRVLAEMYLDPDAKPLEKATSFVSSLLGNFNPIGGGLPSMDAKGLAQVATPSLARPLVDLAVNQNFAGTPIAKENTRFGYKAPAYTQTRESTPEHWKTTAQALNDWTGGDKVKAGTVNMTPEQIAYLLKSYITPGIAPTVDKSFALANSRKELKAKEIPGVNKFFGQIDETNRARAAMDTAKKDQQFLGEYKKYITEGERDKAKQVLRDWGAGDEANGRKLLAQATSYDRIMVSLRKEQKSLSQMADEDTKNKRLSALDDRMNRANAVYLSNTRDLRRTVAATDE